MSQRLDTSIDFSERPTRANSQLPEAKIRKSTSIKDASKPEKISKGKIAIVYAQSVIILILLLSCLLLHFNIYRAGPPNPSSSS